MNITTYNDILKQYNAAWQMLCDLRWQVQQADSYLSAYTVVHHASELHFRIDPSAASPAQWPTAADILQVVVTLKEIGEQVVSAFNQLSMTDRYLVLLPHMK